MSAFSIGATLLDAMVLAILSQADTYGYQITKDIQAHFAVSESTLYPVLRRLQKNGGLITYDQPIRAQPPVLPDHAGGQRSAGAIPAGLDHLSGTGELFLGKPKK